MGIDLEAYRCKIGTFTIPSMKRRKNHKQPAMTCLTTCMLLLILFTVGWAILSQPDSQLQDTVTWCPVSLNTTNTACDTLPVNVTLNLVRQQTTVTTLPILPGDETFLIEHDIGNIAAHLKYGNIIPYRPPRDINKPLDRLYRKGLSIAHINVNGILHKHRIDELKVQLHNKPIGILAISETKVNDTILDDRLEIDGYKLYRHDRLSDGGGGVALYI